MRVVTRLNIGGPSKQIHTLNRHLEVGQFEQLIVTGSVGENEKEIEVDSFRNFIRIRSMGRSIKVIADITSIFELTKIIKLNQPQIIHTHLAKAWLITSIAKSLSKSKAATIHTFHGHNIHSYFTKAKNIASISIQRILARRTDLLIAVSAEVRDDLLSRNIGEQSKFHIVEPGIDSFEKIAKETARSALGINKEIFTIGFIGRFEKIKRPDLLKQIIISFGQSQGHTSCQFILCGGGSLYQELKSELAQTNVKFVEWTRNLAPIYSSLDLMILTSDNEGTPLTVIEAGKMGVPTISRRVGGIGSLIIHNQTGFLSGDSIEEFVNQIHDIISNRKRLAEVAKSTEQFFNDNFSIGKFIAQHEELYKKVINKVC